jgi:hypothetical protein
MASSRYRAAVNGRSTPLGPERDRRWGDNDTVLEMVDRAGNYIDTTAAELWIDCFQLNGDIYEVNVCDCYLPSIVCRTMPDEEPHSKAPSKTTNTMIEALKTSMGASNYNIINELRRKRDQAARAAAEQLPAPAAPSTARIQQVDGTASSTPARVISSASGSLSRSEPSAGAYDDEDGYYDDDRPLGRQRRVIQGKADKVPAWAGSGTERWQEYRASMCAWYYSNRDFLTEGQIMSKLAEMFKSAGETAAADSLLGYSQLGSTAPPLSGNPSRP